MKRTALFLLLAASVAAVSAQTPSKSATHAATAHTATTHAAKSTSVTHSAKSTASRSKIPPVHGIIRTAFSLRYQDYKIGTGPVAEPNKMYHVLYTGYLASTGQIFDSSDEHRRPAMKDGKPELDADGKPVMGEPEPLVFPQGFGRLIPGFDQGFAGMRIGGKRRIFIPWQLGYGTRDIPARGDHPGIPPKSDLVFDVTLVDVTDLPKPPERPMNFRPHPQIPVHPGEPAKPGVPPASKAPGAPAAPAKPAAPESAPKASTPNSTAPATSAPPAGSSAPQTK